MQKFGKFEVVREIGRGGFGKVYEGRDPVLKRSVAIKTCSSDDPVMRQRFQREAEIVASLQHPNITTVHDLGTENGVPYLVQEFLSGEDLTQVIRRKDPLSVADRLKILLRVARALEQAHSQDIIHRDVKPGNIRILDDGTVKVMDFGIAKLASMETDLTKTGHMVGTAGYLAPEQLTDRPLDGRCDIFSFGVVGYELITYHRPFKGSTTSALLYKILHEPHPALSEIWSDAPGDLAQLIDACMAKNPDDRPKDFTEVCRRIEALLAGNTVPTDTEPTVDRTWIGGRDPEVASGGSGPLADLDAKTVVTDRNAAQEHSPATVAAPAGGATIGGGSAAPPHTPPPHSAPLNTLHEPPRSGVSSTIAIGGVAVAILALAAVLWFGPLRDRSSDGTPQRGATTAAGAADPGPLAASAADPPSATAGSALEDEVVTSEAGEASDDGVPPTTDPDDSPRATTSSDDARRSAASARPEPRATAPASRPAPRADPERRPAPPARSEARAPTREPETAPARASTPASRSTSPAASVAPSASEQPAEPSPPAVEPSTTTRSPASENATSSPEPNRAPAQSRDSEPRATAPPAARPEPPPVDHRPAIERVLESYAAAYRALDAEALRRVWPSLSGDQLARIQRSFAAAEAMEVQVRNCRIAVDAPRATAACRVRRTITPKAGRRQSASADTTFQLRLTDGRWVIEDT